MPGLQFSVLELLILKLCSGLHLKGSGRGVEKSDTSYSGPSGITSTSLPASVGAVDSSSPASIDLSGSALPFRADASTLGSYTPPRAAGSSKRRFSEMDRAAERGPIMTYLLTCGEHSVLPFVNTKYREPTFKRGVTNSMPFPLVLEDEVLLMAIKMFRAMR
ncbi:hypothetical protein POM88_016968 [Heracleum sosnowskyi]|uniref:Uncharacterized protein n=1 Tax=Heracleum sosnowskyi TaxID=360622 RepID=A0AAD8INA8_9APIA|nr:hypothetical protein POM88_016968 [Heracleum sosnowskyi]